MVDGGGMGAPRERPQLEHGGHVGAARRTDRHVRLQADIIARVDIGPATTTILQLSDTHLRADRREVYGEDPERRLALVLTACAREVANPDLVVLSGDQSDDGEQAGEERVREIVARIAAPILAVPGNHDDAEGYRRTFPRGAAVEVGAWRVVGLDSSVPGEVHGSVDVDATELLLDDLDERPTMIAIHHPPVPPTNHPWFRLDHADELLASLAARPHVRAVISGHVHTPFTVVRDGLVLMGGPSTLASFLFHGDELTVGAGGPTGARVIRLSDDGSLDSALIEV
jgi:3',5'-cyclic-AMP phosphodiesterase